MFGTLIDIDTEGNILMKDKGVALLPTLFKVYKNKYLGSKAVKWIVAMYDYRSPYRGLPKEQRETMVNNMLLEKDKCTFKEKPLIIDAIKEYKSISYDPDYEEYRSMVDKSSEVIKVFKQLKVNSENISTINDLQVEMGKAAKSRRELKNAIISEIESGNKIAGVGGDDDLSIFEQEEMFK
jgi:hypothetical protein